MADTLDNSKNTPYSLDDLLYLMARLRDPDGGCPWDLKQDFKSITASTIEEAYELVDAIEQADNHQIREELGDVLFQVVFYAQLGAEQALFDFSAIVDGLTQKLIRRHPHVFPNGELKARHAQALTQEDVKGQWELIKQQERQGKAQHGLLDDIPRALPALKRAQKMQKRASNVGFDWSDAQSALSKVKEEIAELEQAILNKDENNIQEELGDLIFSCVNVSRHLKVDAEQAVEGCNRKFESRFNFIEAELKKQDKSLQQASLQEMDHLWEQAKGLDV
ncbi:MAG: nucleoside triphosphate pyrophosphohydrolase [Pseudomonadales bacterium]|nr:nucleoside triphosphate pyrophosphohydrolase [Pseudomonadales bacterium]